MYAYVSVIMCVCMFACMYNMYVSHSVGLPARLVPKTNEDVTGGHYHTTLLFNTFAPERTHTFQIWRNKMW